MEEYPMHNKKTFLFISILIVLGMLLAACQPEPEVVGGELVTIVARCRAKPPTEDWRCNNLLFAVAAVNADLAAVVTSCKSLRWPMRTRKHRTS
jgi:hypothetical protein